MAVKVKVPTPLQKLTKGEAEVSVEGTNVFEVIDNMEKDYPGIKSRLCDDAGAVRRFVNIYKNSEDIRFLNGGET
ncbi:MAG: MoaD/ThiS family protein, partial [bacterium]